MFDLDPQIAAGLLGVGLALIIWVVGSQANEKATVRESLRALEDYEVDSVRDRELLNPLAQRTLVPVLGALTDIGRRLTPAGYIDGVRHKFVLSGRPSPSAIDRFLAVRVVTVVLIPASIVFTYLWNPVGLTGKTQLGVTLLMVLALVLGPDARLNRAVEERQKDVLRGLPDVLDLLVISVEAGLGFEQALQRVIGSVKGSLSDEFSRMLGEVRAGSTRSEAMRAMDARIEVAEIRSFVLAILQADTLASPLAGFCVARRRRCASSVVRSLRKRRGRPPSRC